MKFFIIIKQHSQRVENKNFLEVHGKPLWRHLIDTLKHEDVYIDTDSNHILDACRSIDYITCYKRLDKHINLENDPNFKVSPAILMIDRFLDNYVRHENEIIVTPHVTSPFIKIQTIKDAAQKLEDGYDSVQACTAHKEFCYFQNRPVNFDPNVIQKTQDLEPVKLGNGAFFIFTKKIFKKHMHRTGSNPFLYPISMPESIEIDTYEDLKLARTWKND